VCVRGNANKSSSDKGTTMDSDRTFYGTLLAMVALLFGHPVAAVIIFIFAVM
jgi:hypothetical protein